jgi:hypothetical protein
MIVMAARRNDKQGCLSVSYRMVARPPIKKLSNAPAISYTENIFNILKQLPTQQTPGIIRACP